MTRSSHLLIVVATCLPIVIGCASDLAVSSASLAELRPLNAPTEFTNVPHASPLREQAATKRRIDASVETASADMPADEANNHRTKVAIARLTERSGQIDQAVGMYEAILAREPNNPMPYHRLAVIASQKKQWSQAERLFRKAYTLARPSSELLSDMGYFYYLRHQLDEAKQLSLRALQIDPQNTTAHNNLGLVYGELRMFDESLASFKRAVPAAEAHANFAYVLAQWGENSEAMAHYSTSLTLDDQLRTSAQAMIQLAERHPVQQAQPTVDEATVERNPAPAAVPANRRRDPGYDAVTTVDEAHQYVDVADLSMRRGLAPPRSAPDDRVFRSAAQPAPTLPRRAVDDTGLAEELARYLEHTGQQPFTNAPQPTVEVKPLPEPAAVRPAQVSKTPPPKTLPVDSHHTPAVPIGPTPEQRDAEQAQLAKQRESRRYQPKSNLLDVDRVVAGSRSYRPRSRVGELRPTRRPTSPAPQAKVHVAAATAIPGQLPPAIMPPATIAKQMPTSLDIDRMPEASRWDQLDDRAIEVAPEVSSRAVPRPVQVGPHRVISQQPVARPTVVIENRAAASPTSTTVRFVEGGTPLNASASQFANTTSTPAIVPVSYERPANAPRRQPDRHEPAKSSIRFVPAGR